MSRALYLTKEERSGVNVQKQPSRDALPNNFVIHFQRPNGRTSIHEDVVATGKFKNGEWEFESTELTLKQWLVGVFSQPIASKHGQLNPDSLQFVNYINDFVILRKGLTMIAG